MEPSSLTAPIATVLGALVGASAGISGALLTTWLQLRLEQRRSRQSREDAIARELSGSIQQLTTRMASSVHSMCWLTWLAATRGDRVTQANLDAYDAEQHRILPEILGYMGTVAAVDVGVYQALKPHVDEIFMLDGRIGSIGLSLDRDHETAVRELAGCYLTMTRLEQSLPTVVGNIVSERLREPTGGTGRRSVPPPRSSPAAR